MKKVFKRTIILLILIIIDITYNALELCNPIVCSKCNANVKLLSKFCAKCGNEIVPNNINQ